MAWRLFVIGSEEDEFLWIIFGSRLTGSVLSPGLCGTKTGLLFGSRKRKVDESDEFLFYGPVSVAAARGIMHSGCAIKHSN